MTHYTTIVKKKKKKKDNNMIQVISIHTLGSYDENIVGKIIELTEKNSFLLLSQNIKS